MQLVKLHSGFHGNFLFSQRKNNRIKLILIGQEAVEIFSGAERKEHEDFSDAVIVRNMTRHIIKYL